MTVSLLFFVRVSSCECGLKCTENTTPSPQPVMDFEMRVCAGMEN